MHSARSGDSIARSKGRIETVYLDPCGEFLTQVLIHYMGLVNIHYLDQIHYLGQNIFADSWSQFFIFFFGARAIELGFRVRFSLQKMRCRVYFMKQL